MARQNLTEAGAHTEILERNADGSLLIQIITPGWGSSGYYSAPVLEAAAKDRVWPKGTHMYFDHPSATEASDRPERSVKDLAAVLSEDARWDANGNRVLARVDPVGLGKAVLADEAFRKAVACSVRASAEMSIGEADGRKGWIVEQIHPGTFNSVDFVTHAGRGGMILESARRVEAWEASANDTERALQDAVRSTYNDHESDTYAWMRDYDPDAKLAYFEVSTDGKTAVYQQAYSTDDQGAVSLSGDRTEVNVRTQYVPVGEARNVELTREAALTQIREARNVGQWMESRIHLGFTQVADEMFGNGRLTRDERIALSSGIGDALDAFTSSVEKAAPQLYSRDLWDDPEARAAVAETATPNVPVHPAGQTTNPREKTMPDIEEARLRELEEAHGRVPTLVSERDTAIGERDTARQELAVEKAKNYARDFGATRVKEANSELEADVVDMIVGKAMSEALPLTDEGRLDTEVFGERVDKARTAEETYLAKVAEKRGGDVRGLGPVGEKKEVTREDSDKAIAEAFGYKVKEA
jgi:hypothetical protein